MAPNLFNLGHGLFVVKLGNMGVKKLIRFDQLEKLRSQIFDKTPKSLSEEPSTNQLQNV